MIIDCISDTHGYYPELEGGDLLIVAGDLTARDTHKEMEEFVFWTIVQKYKKVVFIAGNHDNCLVGNSSFHRGPNADIGNPEIAYLFDNGIEFEYERCIKGHSCTETMKIWGSPWTMTFEGMNPHCKAFTVDTEAELAAKWALIPDDIDILIVHGPPYGILDGVHDYYAGKIKSVGSKSLAERIHSISDGKKVRMLVCGHIHEGYGQIAISDTFHDMITWKAINCSHVNRRYRPVNKPVRIIL